MTSYDRAATTDYAPTPSYPSVPSYQSPSTSTEAAPQTYVPRSTVPAVEESYRRQDQPAPAPSSPDVAAPRVARLTIASVHPFSALKVSFLLSVAAGIALVVAVIVLWMVLSSIGVFDQLNSVLGDLGMTPGKKKFDIYDYVGFGKVVSISIVIAVVNAALLTALATLSAFLYNLSAGLVGGVRVTLSDD